VDDDKRKKTAFISITLDLQLSTHKAFKLPKHTMASMFSLPLDVVVCCNAVGAVGAYKHIEGEFTVKTTDDGDDISTLGGAFGAEDAFPKQDALSVLYCEDLVTKAELVSPSECRQQTPLFNDIQSQKWERVLSFLETGKATNFAFCGFVPGNDSTEPPLDSRVQVKTWVNTEDWWGKTIARRLPIHVAIMQKAPIQLVRKLTDIYPEGARAQDLDGNLPLHLSFKHDSLDDIVSLLLKVFPEGVGVKNKIGKQPVDYATAECGAIIKLCVEQTKKAARHEEERLQEALREEKLRLTEILLQLSQVRGEMDELRKTKKKSSDTRNHSSEERTSVPDETDVGDSDDRSFTPSIESEMFPGEYQQSSIVKRRNPWK